MEKNKGIIQALTDAWQNGLTGMGILGKDKRMSTSFYRGIDLSDSEISDIWRGDGLGRRIIKVPIDDLTRNWFRIDADSDGVVVDYLAQLNAKKYIKKAMYWGDLFGKGLVFMGIDDGQPADMPVNIAQIRGIRFFEVYDRRDIIISPENTYTDPTEFEKYGKPRIYSVINRSTGETFNIHESRCLVFNGETIPETEMRERQGAGDSKLSAIYSRLAGVAGSLAGIEGISQEFIIGVLKVNNLAGYIGTKEGRDLINTRLQAFDTTKSWMKTIITDVKEEYQKASSFGVSGLREIVDLVIDVLCGISGMPRVKLIGDQAKGLGGEAAGNVRMYYDELLSRGDDELIPELTKLCKYVIAAKEPWGSKEPPSKWRITLNKLFLPTEKEDAETRLLNAKHDVLYMEKGLSPEYAIAARFGGNSYAYNLTLPEDYIDKLNAVSLDEAMDRFEDVMEKNDKNPLVKGLEAGGTSKDNPGRE